MDTMTLSKKYHFDVAFVVLGMTWAAWDVTTYLTERTYMTRVLDCRTFSRVSGTGMGLPSDDIPMAELTVRYPKLTSNLQLARVEFKRAENFECATASVKEMVNVKISPLTPNRGRLATVAKDWSESLGLSFILIAVGVCARGIRNTRRLY